MCSTTTDCAAIDINMVCTWVSASFSSQLITSTHLSFRKDRSGQFPEPILLWLPVEARILIFVRSQRLTSSIWRSIVSAIRLMYTCKIPIFSFLCKTKLGWRDGLPMPQGHEVEREGTWMPGIHFYMEHISKHGFVTCARVYNHNIIRRRHRHVCHVEIFYLEECTIIENHCTFNEEMVHFAWRKIASKVFQRQFDQRYFWWMLFHHVFSLFSQWDIFEKRVLRNLGENID